MSKVSIIVPIYNSELYISECINSILNQTYKDIEIILVNDGSTDNSLNICKKYKDNRIVIINKDNSGVSDSRNMGIEHSTGNYISFVDSDDIIDTHYIEYLVKGIEKTKFNITTRVSFENNNIPSIDNSKYISKILNENELILIDEMEMLNAPWGKLFNKEIIINNNIRFEKNISLGEDLLFNLEYLKYINAACIVENKLYYYRHSDNNTLGFKYRDNMEQIQLNLLNKYQQTFVNYKRDYPKIYNEKTLNTLNNIIKNEFRNNKINFFTKIKKVKSFLNKKEIKKLIFESQICNNKLKYYILKYRLMIIYYFVLKIKRRFNF